MTSSSSGFTPHPSRPIYSTRAHRRARTTLLTHYTPGDPCSICHHPMHPQPNGTTTNLHADHCPHCQGRGCDQCAGLSPVPGYRGLAHGSKCPTCGHRCNQRDGALRALAAQGHEGSPPPSTTTDDDTNLTDEERRWII